MPIDHPNGSSRGNFTDKIEVCLRLYVSDHLCLIGSPQSPHRAVISPEAFPVWVTCLDAIIYPPTSIALRVHLEPRGGIADLRPVAGRLRRRWKRRPRRPHFLFLQLNLDPHHGHAGLYKEEHRSPILLSHHHRCARLNHYISPPLSGKSVGSSAHFGKHRS